MILALRNPKGRVFLHYRFFSVVNADAGTGDDIDQFRAIVDVIVGPSLWRKDGMTESELLNPFFVWSEQNFYLTLKRSRNFNSFFFRCLDDFQSISFLLEFFGTIGSLYGLFIRQMNNAIDYIRRGPRYNFLACRVKRKYADCLVINPLTMRMRSSKVYRLKVIDCSKIESFSLAIFPFRRSAAMRTLETNNGEEQIACTYYKQSADMSRWFSPQQLECELLLQRSAEL